MSQPSKKILIVAVILGAGTIMAAAVVYGAGRLAHRQLGRSPCDGQAATNYHVVIQDDHPVPDQIEAKQCDTMTITNQDDVSRLMAFGDHDAHQAYDGVTQKVLNKDQSFTVTFVKTGQFHVHDHEDDEVEVNFEVTPR